MQDVVAFNLRFPGQYYDAETGTNYNYHRDFDPAIGRYLESDPIGLHGGLSTYGYVFGRPLVFSDRTGLQAGAGAMPFPGDLGFSVPALGRLCSQVPLLFMLMASNNGDACSDDPSKKRPECKAEDDKRCKKVLVGCREECHIENNDFGHGPDVPGKVRRCIRTCMERQNCFDF